MFSLYRNPGLDTSMAAVKAEDVRASFLFVGDLNGISSGVVGLPTTNRHGVQSVTSQLCLVAISWLSARPMHVVEHLTF